MEERNLYMLTQAAQNARAQGEIRHRDEGEGCCIDRSLVSRLPKSVALRVRILKFSDLQTGQTRLHGTRHNFHAIAYLMNTTVISTAILLHHEHGLIRL